MLAGTVGKDGWGTFEAPHDERPLVHRALHDGEAFGQLYERYAPSIYRFVYSHLRQREAAEDVTADVFFKALRAIDRFDPERPFRPWLYRIALNAVRDHLRQHRPTVALDSVLEQSAPGVGVEERVVARTELDRARTAIERLGDAQRTALILSLGQDMPTAEIAAYLGRSEGAAKLLIHRGLVAIRRSLEDSTATDEPGWSSGALEPKGAYRLAQ